MLRYVSWQQFLRLDGGGLFRTPHDVKESLVKIWSLVPRLAQNALRLRVFFLARIVLVFTTLVVAPAAFLQRFWHIFLNLNAKEAEMQGGECPVT